MAQRRKTAFIAGPVVLLAILGWYYFGGHTTPKGQPSLVTLNTQTFTSFRATFNEAADRVRVVVLLSPT
jgi:hypothetical protein